MPSLSVLLRHLCQCQPLPESSASEYKPGRRVKDHPRSILELIQRAKMSQIPRDLLFIKLFKEGKTLTIENFHFLHTSQTISLSCTCSSDQNFRCGTSWKDRQIFFPSFFSTSTSAEVVMTELDGRNVPGSLPNAPLFIGFTRKTTAVLELCG